MLSLTLAEAETIAVAAVAAARERALEPLALVILDAGGHVVLAKREDGAGILRIDIATGKAWGAIGMGYGTREIAARAQSVPAFVAAIGVTSGGRIVPSPGGVLVLRSGTVIGAVGVSGDTGDNDEAAALVGIAATGLDAAPGLRPAP